MSVFRFICQSSLFSVLWLCFSSHDVLGQTGSIHEPVRYVGGPTIHQNSHDGRLRPAIGVESVQVVRVNRTHPDLAEGFGWTYSHAPMIAY